MEFYLMVTLFVAVAGALGFGAGRLRTRRSRSIALALLLILTLLPFLVLALWETQEHSYATAIFAVYGMMLVPIWLGLAGLGFAIGRRTSRDFLESRHRS
jgi:hypothetical protein